MKSLLDQLQAIKAASAGKFTPDVVAAIKEGFIELQHSMVREKALGVGDSAPVFSLPNTRGDVIESAHLLAAGPLVVLFYRGKW